MSSLAQRMSKVLRDYRKRERKQVQQRKEENRKYLTEKAQNIQNERVQRIKQSTKRLKQSSTARGVAGFTKGFASGFSFAPVRESKNETFGDPRIRQWAPKAANQLQSAVNKARTERDKTISKSKSGKIGSVAGNAAGTIAGALVTSGATKAVAGKALGTKTGQKAVRAASEKLTQHALKSGAKKNLTRKLLERAAENSGRKATETSMRIASKKLTGKIAENIAQDVAYDATLGAAKDVSRYIESGKDPRKNPADFAKYMAGNAAANTVYGAIGNVILPGIGAYKKSGKLWKTVERLGDDGKIHKVKVRANELQRVRAARDAAGEATDILSPKLKTAAKQGAEGAQENMAFNTVKNAMHDKAYLKEIRKNGINGKSVRQLASEQNRSVADIISEDYAKRYGDKLDYARESKRAYYEPTAGRTATGNRIAHRPGYDPQAAKELSSVEAPTQTTTATQAAATPTQTATKQTNPAPNVTSEQAAPTSASTIDTSMGGTRTGAEAGRSKAADTAIHAKGLSKKDTEEIDKYLKDTKADRKWTETNKTALDDMAKRIDEDGINASAISLRRKFEEGQRWTNEDTAEVALLNQKLTSMKRIAEQAGNVDEAKRLTAQRDQLYAIGAMEGSEAGKTLQAQKMYNALTPEGRVHAAELMRVRMKNKLGVDVKDVDESLYDELRNAKTEREIQAAKDKIARAYWDQVPPNLTEKLSAWRYLSMLGNPKTHIRNIVGNTVFMAPRAIKNTIAAGAERVLLPKNQRTKAIVNPLTDSSLLKKAKSEWDEVKDTFMNGSEKYESLTRRPEGSAVFKFKPLQKLSDFNTWALTKEDEIFAEIAYKNAYAGFLKARGIDPATASAKTLSKARDYAWDEALTATYRESNIVADFINKARAGANISRRDFERAKNGREMKELALKKAVGTATDALVPFAKTPANILKEGINYSPAGLVKVIGDIASRKSVDDVVEAIDDAAQALTGTGLLALGMYAASSGAVTSSIETGYDNLKQRLGTYNKDRGMQDYSFMVNDGALKINGFDLFNLINSEEKGGKHWNVTGDSLVPAAMPFFQGVELYNAIFNGDTGESSDKKFVKFATAMANMSKLTDPVMNLSMLSSIQNAFDTWQSSSSGTSALNTFIQNTIQSRLGQYVPTVGGQVVNTMRDAKPSASPTNTGMVGDVESFLRQQANKVPFLTNINADKSDAFGQKINEKKDHSAATYIKSGAKNFLSPLNIREMRDTPADREIQRLVTEEGQAPNYLLPQTQRASDITTKYGKKTFDVNQRDVADFNEMRGQYALDHINSLIKTKAYSNASSEEKAEMIKDIYKEASTYANEKLALTKGVTGRDFLLGDKRYVKNENKMKELGIKPDDYAKIWKRVGKIGDSLSKNNIDGTSGAAYVAKTLAATEVKNGVTDSQQAKAATNANPGTWKKVYNLSQRGFTAKQCVKFALTDKEKDLCSNEKGKLDRNKLAAYINGMNCSQREKWARFETNRPAYDWFTNPF